MPIVFKAGVGYDSEALIREAKRAGRSALMEH